MKLVFAVLCATFAATASFGGAEMVPPMEPEASSDSNGDATGALILLALVGMVIASGQMGSGVAGRSANKLHIHADDIDESAGF
ncbi:MAG: hypothetical protein AAFP85_14180 [Pseudomonadota bacterium]